MTLLTALKKNSDYPNRSIGLSRQLLNGLCLIGCLLIVGCLSTPTYPETPLLEIHCIDVGYGDAIIVRKGETVCLIDGGYPTATQKVLEYMDRHAINSLDAAFLTHPHPDHIGAFHGVLASGIPVETVYCPFPLDSHLIPDGFRRMLETRKISYQIVKCGQVIQLNNDLRFDIVHPCQLNSDMNDSSLVLFVQGAIPDNSALLTADIGPAAQAELLQRHPELFPVTVLKAPHHGGHSLAEFYEAAQPEITVICDGINPYGNPWPSTLDAANLWSRSIFRLSETGSLALMENPLGSSSGFMVKITD